MFQYDTTTANPASAAPAARTPKPAFDLGQAFAVAGRNAKFIAATGIVGALVAYGLSNVLTPKYVATAEIYVDPGSAQSANTDPIAPGQDSNGFVNYVETQKLIVTSRSVLDRVVRAEDLDRDPDYGGDATPSLLAALFHGSSGVPGDPVAAAARVLATHVLVTRPERTFVLDIIVSDKDPARAASIANATARAYVEEVAQLRADASMQTGAAIADRLENLRADVLKAEAAIETYKADKGLAGARDVSTIEQQLKTLQDEIGAQRGKESDARSRAEGAETARKSDVDLGAFASQFGLMTLSQLRGQQGEARQKLADARADLGPRHPDTIQAEARVKAADAAVDAELERFGRSQRLEYQRAKATETELNRQLEAVKKLTNTDDAAMVGLRDLERKAQAARDVYELFVTRSRDSGAIQEVAPTRTKVITVASPPKTRAFPPSAAVLAGLGFVAGLALGLAGAIARENRKGSKSMPTVPATAPAPPPIIVSAPPELRVPQPAPEPVVEARKPQRGPKRFVVGAIARLVTHSSPQTLTSIDLTGLGFRTLTAKADASEFREMLETLEKTRKSRLVIAVTGDNEGGQRSALAINLALTAVRSGTNVALIDAAGRNAKITRAVRLAARCPILDKGVEYDTVNKVLLVLPKAGDAERGRVKPLTLLRELIGEGGMDWIISDGPDAGEFGASEFFAHTDAVVALDDEATAEKLEDLGLTPAAYVRFEPAPVMALKRA